MKIKAANKDDTMQISKLHKYAFDKSHFTSTFSVELLSEFYQKLIDLNDFCYVAYDDLENELYGFIIAGISTQKALDELIKKRWITFSFLLIKNPSFILSKVSHFIKKTFFPKAGRSENNLRLLSIAVNPAYQNKKVGKQLINYLEDRLLSENYISYGLSVKKSNAKAIQFYERNNYKIEFETKDAIYYFKNLKN